MPPNASARLFSSFALLSVLGLISVGGIAGDASASTRHRTDHEVNVPHARALLDGFEVDPWPDPGLWTLPPDSAPMWWPSTCHAKSGRRSLWAFGGPTINGEMPCDSAAPAGTSNVVVMNLDLTDTLLASKLELYFDLWLRMPAGDEQGLFIHLLVPEDGGTTKRVPIFGATGTAGDWAYPARRLDLLALADTDDPDNVYDLRGGRWRMEWTALAPLGTPRGGGIYIDDIVLAWEPDPAVPTPTIRPTLTITPSPSPTITSTPKPPTSTSTPWAPHFGTTYLPILYQSLPELATASATPATGTPDSTAEPTATEAGPTATLPVFDYELYLPRLIREPQPTATPTASATEDTGTTEPDPTETATPDGATASATPTVPAGFFAPLRW